MLSSVRSTRAFAAARPVVPVQRVQVVVNAKATKAADLKSMSSEAMLSKINELKIQIASNRFLRKTGGRSLEDWKQEPTPESTPKPHANRELRKEVAKMYTILRERQIADGIDRREYRKLKRNVALSAKFQ